MKEKGRTIVKVWIPGTSLHAYLGHYLDIFSEKNHLHYPEYHQRRIASIPVPLYALGGEEVMSLPEDK